MSSARVQEHSPTSSHVSHNSSCPAACHVAMLKDPKRWPQWARLPLKHRTRTDGVTGMAELAVAVNDAEAPGKLLLLVGANLCGVYDPNKVTSRELTPEEIVAEGWVVD